MRAISYSSPMHPEEEAIHKTLATTLLAGRLPPGAKLAEARLAAIFDVSRERVRKVLHRLGHERLIEVIPNRGSFVSNPSLVQAREIYEARRIVEGGIVARLAGRLTPEQLRLLDNHEVREHAALKAGDRALSIRLSGEFHMLLAGFTDVPFVVRELQELVSRTSMLVAFFEEAGASECACDEHEGIVGAMRRGDAAAAMKAMHTHLSLIETRLKPRAAPSTMADPETEVARAWARAKPKKTRKAVP